MVGSNGVRLIHCLLRRSHSLFHHPNSKALIAGGLRSFTAGLGNPIGNHTPRFAKTRNCLVFGVINLNLGARQPIHGTAPLSARDYYDVLGVNKSATASEIKKAYFGLAKKLHPAVNKDDPEAEKKFQEVSKAYEVGHDAFEQQQNNSGGFSKEDFNPFKFTNFHDMQRG